MFVVKSIIGICVIAFVLVFLAGTVILSLISLYTLNAGGNIIASSGTGIHAVTYGTNLNGVSSATISNGATLASSLNSQYQLDGVTITTARFIQSTSSGKKRRRQVRSSSTSNSVLCQTTTTTGGDYLYLEIITNYSSTCTTSQCHAVADRKVNTKFTKTNQAFILPIIFTNGSSVNATVSFCSLDHFITNTATNGSASNSYSDCLAVASKFATTTTGPVPNITATTGINVTCSELSSTSCPGSIINGVCTWQRKMAITCINGSTVRIRIQSNGLPGRCAAVPSTTSIKEQNFDFEVDFNPVVSVNSPKVSASTQSELYNIVCNITEEQSVPSSSNYVSYSAPISLQTLAGLSIDNVAILNVNSLNNVDPFYPPAGYSSEMVDACLAHPQMAGIYHYHMGSGCAVSPPTGNITSCMAISACASNISYYSLTLYPASAQTLTVVGIAKDGHVIYGPYTSAGGILTSGFDICNGMFYDSIGNYAYFTTITYPYITGCFGPGNYPSFGPNCTTNGQSSYSMSSYASYFASG